MGGAQWTYLPLRHCVHSNVIYILQLNRMVWVNSLKEVLKAIQRNPGWDNDFQLMIATDFHPKISYSVSIFGWLLLVDFRLKSSLRL